MSELDPLRKAGQVQPPAAVRRPANPAKLEKPQETKAVEVIPPSNFTEALETFVAFRDAVKPHLDGSPEFCGADKQFRLLKATLIEADRLGGSRIQGQHIGIATRDRSSGHE